MIDVDIVDAHHHLADLSRSYPWLEGPVTPRYHGDDRALRRDYLLEDYLSDIAHLPVTGSVHIENGAADPIRESRWIDRIIADHRLPSAQVAKVDLAAPNAAGLIEEHALLNSVRGIRDILNWHPDPFYSHRDRRDLMQDPRWLAGFERLERHGLSFDLQVFPEQLVDAARFAGDHPSTAIVLDHAGMLISREREDLETWQRGMRTLAAQPNTHVKISALGTNDHHWTLNSIRPIVLEAIDIFGPHRAMFGSNFPVDGLYSSATELYGAFDVITADFTRSERVGLFSGVAREFYRLDPSGDDY